ncbi:MAG: S41 family peptidase [Candidatus Dadabacteria bacterium]|nr:S41 family peptidase [Candidatus Dadabacteria bacterium]
MIKGLSLIRTLAVCLALLGLSVFLGCGDTYETVQKEEPVFYSSETFADICADPSKAYYKELTTPGIYADENNWLRSWSNETYLWYDEIKDQDPACCSTPVYFELMKTFETNAAGDPKDKFHFTQSTVEYLQSRDSVSSGYGARFVLLQASPPRDVRVAYTEPNSPATSSGVNLSRGARILAIDGERVLDSNNIDVLNAGLYPEVNKTHTFTVLDLGSDTPRTVTMTSAAITSSPVHNVDILTASNGDRIGYMLFNDHSAPAAEAIISAGRKFLENSGIDDLIIDFRYNGGGLLYVAQILASMVAGTEKEGEVFEKVETNGKGYIDSETFNFAFEFPAEDTLSDTDLTVPSIGLKRLFVLTSDETCSASESIISALRGVDIDVIVIGSPTCGKPYGFLPTENCGTVYFSINFRGVNAKGEADYEKGFTPTCQATEDFNHLLGDPEEILLKTALAYRDGGTCPDSGSTAQRAPGAASQADQQSLSGEPISIQPSGLPGKIIHPRM